MLLNLWSVCCKEYLKPRHRSIVCNWVSVSLEPYPFKNLEISGKVLPIKSDCKWISNWSRVLTNSQIFYRYILFLLSCNPTTLQQVISILLHNLIDLTKCHFPKISAALTYGTKAEHYCYRLQTKFGEGNVFIGICLFMGVGWGLELVG